MNKKLLSSCMVLSICAIALAPIYKQLDINSNNTLHPMSTWQTANLEKISSIKKYGFSDDRVTYPQNEEKAVVLAVKTENPSTTNSKASTINKAATSAAPKKVAASRKPSTSVKTASTKRTTTTQRTSTTSVNRGTTAATSSKAAAVISTAKKYIGVPYVWGGQSPSGFDCSGFTQYVLSKNGISVPRTAAEQYAVGTSVSKSNLRVGDLVFFTTYKAGPSHLGFYIGNGQFIHASSSKGVTISSLSSSYYSGRYIGARRVIN